MVCSLWPALPGAPVSSARNCCVLLFGLGCSTLLAQPDYQLSRILFEPHPIPAAELSEYESADASAAETIVDDSGHSFTAAAPYSRFSFAASADTRTEFVTTISEEDRANAEAAIEAYRDTIVDTEGEAGPFSSELFEQLVSLGEAYQQLEQHDEALATLEKAEYISRINNGLFAPGQFAVVEQMVDSLIASGDMQEAMKKQQYLLYLNTQFYGYDSKQLVPALERLGDWSMEAFENGVHGSTWQGFVVSRSGVPGLTPFARPRPNMSPRGQAISSLDSAQRRYYQAISNLLDANDFRNQELLELEEKLQKSVYFSGHRKGLMKDPDFYLDARVDATGSRISHPEFTSNMTAFVNGRNSMHRTLIYLENMPGSDPLARVVTLLNLGDWHAIYNRMYEAGKFYRQATELAASLPERRAEWAPLLVPDVPRQLPDFITLPHSRGTFGITDDAAVEFDGYVDVKMSLSRSGNVRSMEMLKMSDNVTPELSKRLRRLIRAAPYRPGLEQGEPVASEKLVRYYFADMREETRI